MAEGNDPINKRQNIMRCHSITDIVNERLSQQDRFLNRWSSTPVLRPNDTRISVVPILLPPIIPTFINVNNHINDNNGNNGNNNHGLIIDATTSANNYVNAAPNNNKNGNQEGKESDTTNKASTTNSKSILSGNPKSSIN